MLDKDWVNVLDADARIRSRINKDHRGRIAHFTVQLEIQVDETWYPAVRYDNAHGQAHIDFIDPQGVTYNKVWLPHWAPYNNAFTLADHELKATYGEHRQRFLKQLEGR